MQNNVSVEYIIRCLEALPAEHLSGLSEIEYDPSRETQSLFTQFGQRVSSGKEQGQFLQRSRSVVLYTFNTVEDFRHLLYHELGHHVYYNVIDSITKKKWVTEIYPGSAFVTDYASKNASEDFAECYAFYVNNPGALRRIQRKYSFMLNHIFRKRAAAAPLEIDI